MTRLLDWMTRRRCLTCKTPHMGLLWYFLHGSKCQGRFAVEITYSGQQNLFLEFTFLLNQNRQSCIPRLQNIIKSDNQWKLFTADGCKTKACVELQILIWEDFEETSTATTPVMCRDCADKNATVVKKIVNIREKFAKVKKELIQQRGSTSVKWRCWSEPVQEACLHTCIDGAIDLSSQPLKWRTRTSLFQDVVIKDIKIPTHRVNYTQTMSWPVHSEEAGESRTSLPDSDWCWLSLISS